MQATYRIEPGVVALTPVGVAAGDVQMFARNYQGFYESDGSSGFVATNDFEPYQIELGNDTTFNLQVHYYVRLSWNDPPETMPQFDLSMDFGMNPIPSPWNSLDHPRSDTAIIPNGASPSHTHQTTIAGIHSTPEGTLTLTPAVFVTCSDPSFIYFAEVTVLVSIITIPSNDENNFIFGNDA